MAKITGQDSSANVVQLGGSIKLYGDQYVIRCVSEEYGVSNSSGNNMITQEWEIVGKRDGEGKVQAVINIDGKQVDISGKTVKKYVVLTAKAAEQVFDHYEKLGYPELREVGFDTENPFSDDRMRCKGLLAEAMLSSEANEMRKELTPEDKAAGKKMGDPIIYNGVKQVYYRPTLDRILGATTL